MKHLVLVLTVHQVHTGPDVGGARSMRHEAQGQLHRLSQSTVLKLEHFVVVLADHQVRA